MSDKPDLASSLAPSGEALGHDQNNCWPTSLCVACRLQSAEATIMRLKKELAALLASQETLLQSKTLVCDECSGVIPAAEPIILCDICGPKDRQADIDTATVELRAKGEAASAELKTLRASQETLHWQPITTAPKDGTNVLVWDSDDRRPYVATWHTAQFYWLGVGHGTTLRPQYWQPLPPKPENVK